MAPPHTNGVGTPSSPTDMPLEQSTNVYVRRNELSQSRWASVGTTGRGPSSRKPLVIRAQPASTPSNTRKHELPGSENVDPKISDHSKEFVSGVVNAQCMPSHFRVPQSTMPNNDSAASVSQHLPPDLRKSLSVFTSPNGIPMAAESVRVTGVVDQDAQWVPPHLRKTLPAGCKTRNTPILVSNGHVSPEASKDAQSSAIYPQRPQSPAGKALDTTQMSINPKDTTSAIPHHRRDTNLPPHILKFYDKYAPDYLDQKLRKYESQQMPPMLEQQAHQQSNVPGTDAAAENPNISAEETGLSGSAADRIPRPSDDPSLTYNGVDEAPSTTVKDIRGEVPIETWTNQDWEAIRDRKPHRKGWESDTMPSASDGNDATYDRAPFSSPNTFLHRYIRTWMQDVPQAESDLLQVAGHVLHESHDIDPVTGQPEEPIEVPDARVDPNDHRRNPVLLARVANQTAAWSSGRYSTMMKRKEAQEEEMRKRIQQIQQEREMEETKLQKNNPFLCRAVAHLRPAKENDMEEVSRIYNQEVVNGWRTFDQNPTPIAHFVNHLRFCRAEKYPFLVALSGYRNPEIPVDEVDHQVIGFAFLDVASRGVFGSTKSHGNHSSRLYVMVDPDYRRNRVATALIDRMLMMTSRGYMNKEHSYQFVNTENDPMYESELHAPRDWRILQLEILVKNLGTLKDTKDGDEYKFIENWLRTEFLFSLETHASGYGVNERQGRMSLDRLLFEHQCREHDGILVNST